MNGPDSEQHRVSEEGGSAKAALVRDGGVVRYQIFTKKRGVSSPERKARNTELRGAG